MDDIDLEEEPLDPVYVWVNSGFGRKSHYCLIRSTGMMTLPGDLVQELRLKPHDDVEFSLDPETMILYATAIHRPWASPGRVGGIKQMTDTGKFIGMNETAARALAAESGLKVAVNKGVASLLTNSVEMNRVTFVVNGGIVITATLGMRVSSREC